jgi:NAD(P)H-nitrite reductase large subunit
VLPGAADSVCSIAAVEDMMQYLIIGNGVAGVEAANAIRLKSPDAAITIVTGSKYPYYFRPKLIDYLSEDLPREKLYIFKEEHFASKKIDLVLDTGISSIDSVKKRVRASSGREFQYDKLLLALGASPFVPPIENVTKDGVFTLRGIDSADRIKAWCKGEKQLLIAGGGLLGIETGCALRNLCDKVTVVELVKSLLPRQLDVDGGEFLRKILESKGLSFFLGDSIRSVNGKDRIESVTLNSGVVLEADALVLSSGIRSKIGLARDAGLITDQGIVINEFMQTSSPDIFAAGDCCQFGSFVYGLWIVAKEQGRLAGLNMVGEKTAYAGSVPSAMLKVSGIDLFSSGDFLSSGETEQLSTGSKYIRFVHQGEIPLGAIVIGDSDAVKVAQRVMLRKAPVDDMKKIIQG